MPDDEEGASPTRRMEEIDLLRRRVINVIGHELRTPVTTIRGLAETLVTADPALVRAEVAPRLVANVRRLELLLDDMLIASGVSTALPVGDPREVLVTPVVRDRWAELSPEEDLVVSGDGAATVLIRPTALDRVLRHILANAARYGERPVAVDVTRDDDLTRIVVTSPGKEVPQAELDLAFEPFFRGEAAVMSAPGFGLGLTVARVLLDQAGGTIGVARRAGGGVVTTLAVPA